MKQNYLQTEKKWHREKVMPAADKNFKTLRWFDFNPLCAAVCHSSSLKHRFENKMNLEYPLDNLALRIQKINESHVI